MWLTVGPTPEALMGVFWTAPSIVFDNLIFSLFGVLYNFEEGGCRYGWAGGPGGQEEGL